MHEKSTKNQSVPDCRRAIRGRGREERGFPCPILKMGENFTDFAKECETTIKIN